MKIFVFLLLVAGLSFNRAFAVTPSALKDGVVVFAMYDVNGEWVFEEERKNEILVFNPNAQVVNLNPTTFEMQVAQSGIKFSNYSDFVRCVENKEYLDDKILDLKPSEYKKKKNSIDTLKIENNKR